MNYSIQLYSVRDIEDLDELLKKVAELGYKEVEFAGYRGHSGEEIRAMLDKYGLEVSGTHAGLQPLLDDFDGTVEFNKKIGNKHYIIPGHDLSSQDKLDSFIANVNELNEKLKEHGITLAFHNHAGEFKNNADGSVVYEQLIYRTNIQLEVDTYWAFVGMKNPIALLERIKERITFIHLKDGNSVGKGTPLGMGEAPVKAVYDWAVANGKRIVVESETLTPSGIDEAKICFNYLKTIE